MLKALTNLEPEYLLRVEARWFPPPKPEIGLCILWMLHCASQNTPIFEVSPVAWVHRDANRGVFRTEFCVELPEKFCIPIGGHYPSLTAVRRARPNTDRLYEGRHLIDYTGELERYWICSEDEVSPAVLGHLINSPLRLKRSQKYEDIVHPEAIKADQRMRVANCSFVDNCRVPHLVTKRRYSSGGEPYGRRAEMIGPYGIGHDLDL